MLGDDTPSERTVVVPNWRLAKWFPGLKAGVGEKLKIYHSELLRFNKATNLISAKTANNADLLHFADSIIGGGVILNATEAEHIYDIGSGNGFPGLVLAIMDPVRKFTLVDSDMRKLEFLKHIISSLKLTNVDVEHARVEDFPEGSIECAVSRAFAPLAKAMSICSRAMKPGSCHYHFKSDSWGTEVLRIPIQIGRNWEPSLVGDYNLPGVKLKLSIVSVKKIGRK